jgi:mono/diheme cytochrome c family protein
MSIRKPTLFGIALLLTALGSSGCSKEATASSKAQRQSTPETPSAPRVDAPVDPVSEAKKIFETRCAVCHGVTGRGDGPGAAALSPRPQNFSDQAWQSSADDASIIRVILEGGAAVRKSPAMPPSADLRSKEPVLTELVKMIRGFGE